MLQFEAYVRTQEGYWSGSWNICDADKGDLESAVSA